MNRPLVSWLMPVYHSENTLQRSLDSMLNQTMQDFEIILVAEYGCNEETLAICRSYACRDNRIYVHENKKRLGIAASLNVGIKLCKGKYIARMDTDDYSYPQRLARQTEYMEMHPEIGVLGCNVRIMDGEDIRIRYETIPGPKEIQAELLFEMYLCHPSMMLRADMEGLAYPDEIVEDHAFCLRLLCNTRMAIMPEVLLDYIQDGSNTSSLNYCRVRKNGEKIVREAIENILGVHTEQYESSHFGWRYFDNMPKNPERFLLDSIRLLREIRDANEKKKIFDPVALFNVLCKQFELSKWLVRPYNELPVLFYDIDHIMDRTVHDAFLMLEILNGFGKVILYGTGQYCSELIGQYGDVLLSKVGAFCDRCVEKQGTLCYGRPVISPDDISTYDYEYIGIASLLYAEEIRETLIGKYHVDSGKILVPPTDIPLHVSTFHGRNEKRKIRYERSEKERRVFLFAAPDYGNIGYHAIAEAEKTFFRRCFDRNLVEIPNAEYRAAYPFAKDHIREDDLICITGGGFLGSLWIESEYQVREIIKSYPDNPIIILPQTLYWEEGVRWEKQKRITEKIYREHGSLLICARDKRTEKLVQECYPGCHVMLVPDMVLSMDWQDYFDCHVQRQGALICLKNDKESILSEDDKTYLKNLGLKLCGSVGDGSTNVTGFFGEEERKKLLYNKLSAFAASELIITDRLHGLLFAVVTGTPCVAMNNCNHKIKETFMWVRQIENVQFAENLGEVEEKAEIALRSGAGRFEPSRWDREFEPLREAIHRWSETRNK